MGIRKPNFAGSWYPKSASDCEREIQSYLNKIQPTGLNRTVFGGIAPHAGWYFSGAIICTVITALSDPEPPDVVAIFGMHLPRGAPNIMMDSGIWETPFGGLPVNESITQALTKRFSFRLETHDNYYQDNTIEILLPFVKYFLPNVSIVAVGVPPEKESVDLGRSMAAICREHGLKLKVLGSTDLTHYGPNYGKTDKGRGMEALNWMRNENDRGIIEAIKSLDENVILEEGIKNQNACCTGAVATAVACAKALGAKQADMLAYATSYDKNPGQSFVGYVGMVL